MSAIFALYVACSNALYVTTQHIASTTGRVGKASDRRLVAYLIRSPLWLFGWAAALGAFLFQAAALNNGQLSIMQGLLVTELIFGLLLRKAWIRQAVRPAAWGSAALAAFGGAAALMALAAR